MVYAVISDIHANLEATKAVLAKLKDIVEIHSIGDVVGYGPNPNECCELVQALHGIKTMGNHDAYVSGAFADSNVTFAGSRASEAIALSTGKLTPENRRWLKTLATKEYKGNAFFSHGNPAIIEPYCIMEYLLDKLSYYRDSFSTIDDTEPVQSILIPHDAKMLIELFNSMLDEEIDEAYFGHSHLAFAARRPKEKDNKDIELIVIARNIPKDTICDGSFELELDPDYQYALNPGAVGQPRDLDRRASCLVRDGNKAIWHRVAYDPTETTKKMHALGIAQVQIERLWQGK